MDEQFTIITYENTNFTRKKGDRLLNYIAQYPNGELIIFSTYSESNLKYYGKISNISHNELDILIDSIKHYTWTIELSKGIKTSKDKKWLSLREHLKNQLHNLYPTLSITIDKTPPNIRSHIESIHKKSNKSS